MLEPQLMSDVERDDEHQQSQECADATAFSLYGLHGVRFPSEIKWGEISFSIGKMPDLSMKARGELQAFNLLTGFPGLCLDQAAQYNSAIMMAMVFRRPCSRAIPLIISLILLTVGSVLVGSPSHAAANSLVKGQELSRQADALIKEGHEQQAAELYLAAHMQFQDVILKYFESALRESLGGQAADKDEEALLQAGSHVGDLRNVNLSKLWIIVDPEDRTYRQGLEAERAALLQQFDQFIRADSAGPLEAFLYRLYPEDESGEHQMEAVREGQMPRSKRWERLQRPLSP